jgi:Ca2+-binding EF-hand superfamily protein
MIKQMLTHFDFVRDLRGYEQFVMMIEKFLSNSGDKHLFFVFDLIDLNQDRYICFKDLYKALSM